MKNIDWRVFLGAVMLTACGADLPGVGDVLRDGGEARTAEEPTEPGLSADEIEVLNDLGLGLPYDVPEMGLGEVTVTPAGSGVPIKMEGLALQLRSNDRFYDNTLVFAWAGLDVDAGTADYLLRFRASGLADVGVQPLDALSNAMLPTWIIFSDAAADTTYYNDDGELTIDAITLDPATEVDCLSFEPATCSTGTIEGTIDMSALGYAGFGTFYQAPRDRGVSTTTLDVAVEYDVPVERAQIDR